MPREKIGIVIFPSEGGGAPQALFSYKDSEIILELREATSNDDALEVAEFYADSRWGISLSEEFTLLKRGFDPETKSPTYQVKTIRPMSMGEMIVAFNQIEKGKICKGYFPKAHIYGEGFLSDLKAYMPSKRSYINSDMRKEVYNKCGGHCAYCGRKILYGEMQVDHVESHYRHLGTDTLDNYLPSCRDCNGLKSDYYLEEFREKLIPDCGKRARTNGMAMYNNYRYVRIARAYDLLKNPNKKIVFYFERMKKDEI